MCGICGVVSSRGQVDSENIVRMRDALSHRGPDDKGLYVNNGVGFGFRRLSIIDLSPDGAQPMCNEDGSLWLVYNGEIYNYATLRDELMNRGHAFRSKTDSEVIIHAFEEWGEHCLERFNGMFAFALWDEKEQRFFAARDRLGVKPLFYYQDADKLLFGSELKAILQYPNIDTKADETALSDFFSLNYIPPPGTPIRNIRALPPGHYLSWKAGESKETKYWDVKLETGNGDHRKETDVIEELLERFTEAVRKRLVADVPLGAFLSGGLDSSAVVYFMRHYIQQPLKTFNVRFEDPSYDEGPYAREMAQLLHTEHHEIVCTPKDLVSSFETTVRHADNLTADLSNVPLYLVSRLAADHVKVVLSGDGGDELFLGYPIYQADRWAAHYRRLPLWLHRLVFSPLVDALPTSTAKLSFDYKARKFVEGARRPPAQAHFSWRTIFNEEEKRALFTKDFAASVSDHFSADFWEELFSSCANGSYLENGVYTDYKTFLAGSILPKVDTMSMANSLEARTPFLDYEFVEFMAGVPTTMKMRGFKTKYLFKQAMRPLLSARIVDRKKAGFHTPLPGWFRTELRTWVDEILSQERISATGRINPANVERLKSEHFQGRANHAFKLWGLMNFVKWHDCYGRFLG